MVFPWGVPYMDTPKPRSPKETQPMTKTAVYVRVSTKDQNEAGQRREIERWLKGHNITDATFYVDTSTGDNMDRPAFKSLQEAVFNGEVKTIVVYKVDRIGRKMIEGMVTLGEWLDKGIKVVSVTQQMDFSGPMGKSIAALLFGFAEQEQETRRERQRAGIDAIKTDDKLRAKKYPGRKTGTTKGKPKRATELRERGFTYKEIANAMNVSQQTVRRYLGVVK